MTMQAEFIGSTIRIQTERGSLVLSAEEMLDMIAWASQNYIELYCKAMEAEHSKEASEKTPLETE